MYRNRRNEADETNIVHKEIKVKASFVIVGFLSE